MNRGESFEQCCFCGTTTIKECSGCGWAYYCSRDCQEKHWPIHREFCNAQYEQRYPKLEGMRIVPCKKELVQRRKEIVQASLEKSKGQPCCGICADTDSVVQINRFAGILICTECVEIQGKM